VSAEPAPESLVYLVGCNFTDAEREQEWNDWYNGPKLAMMLAMPMFESGQRFEAVGLEDEVRYLAVWRVESAAAFETEKYRSEWGFADYAEDIGDWTRDLCGLEGERPISLACPTDGKLHFIRIETADPDLARKTREDVASRCPDLTWGTAVGLDKSVPFVAVRVLAAGGPDDAPDLGDLPVRQTLLRPLIPHSPAPTSTPQG
jgi:hypothetical protein